MAYKLDLPPTSKIHSVVHVSLPKKAEGAKIPISPELPPTNEILQAEHAPLAILASKHVRVAGQEHTRLLVHWEGLPASLTTWENPGLLQQQFPTSPPWGQGGTQGRVNVTTDLATPQPPPCNDRLDVHDRRIGGEPKLKTLASGPGKAE